MIKMNNKNLKIGDKGPVGGWIFDIKGEIAFETAPKDFSEYLTWGRSIKACYESVWNGFANWRLPTKDELNLMYLNLHKRGLGEFVKVIYWSSSDGGTLSAWIQSFKTGDQRKAIELDTLKVRAIRSFKLTE
jgi:hypothetical protein